MLLGQTSAPDAEDQERRQKLSDRAPLDDQPLIDAIDAALPAAAADAARVRLGASENLCERVAVQVDGQALHAEIRDLAAHGFEALLAD